MSKRNMRKVSFLIFSLLLLMPLFQNCGGDFSSQISGGNDLSSQELPGEISNSSNGRAQTSNLDQQNISESAPGEKGFSISSFNVREKTSESFYVDWELNNFGTGVIVYSTSPTDLSMSTKKETSFSFAAHTQKISNLRPLTTYYIQMISEDKNGQIAKSKIETVTTNPAGGLQEPQAPIKEEVPVVPNRPVTVSSSGFSDTEFGPRVRAGQPINACPNIPTTFRKKTIVKTYAEFQAAYAVAAPGDAIVIPKGTYNWNSSLPKNNTYWIDSNKREKVLILDRNGTAENPIYILSESIHGAVFKNMRSSIAMIGQFNVVAGFYFDGAGQIQISGSDNRVGCNYFINYSNYVQAARMTSSRTEMDNNVIDGAARIGVVFYSCNPAHPTCTTQSRNHHIHHNKWTNKPFMGENGHDAMFLGLNYSPVEGTKTYADTRMDAIVENNLFDGWNGEEELISVKSDGHIIRNNCVMNASKSNIFIRDGDDILMTGNWIEGSDRGSRGLQIAGERSVIAFNYMGVKDQYAFRMYSLESYRTNATGQFGTYMYVGASDGDYQYNVINGPKYLVTSMGTIGGSLVTHPKNTVIKNNHIYSSSFVGTNESGGHFSQKGRVSEAEFRSANHWGKNTIFRKKLPSSFCGDASLFSGPGGKSASVQGHAGLTGGAQVIRPPSWW